MVFNNLTILLGAICMTNALMHIAATWRNWSVASYVFKIAASTAFVALAILNGATDSTYGRFVLIALIFSWVGDALLLSLDSNYLLAGMAAFFLAHAAFAVALATQSLDSGWLAIFMAILGASALAVIRWLWKYLSNIQKIAVPLYLTAITVMTSLAISASAASGSALLAIAAIFFTASDISVARNRFVARSIVNKMWGLPLYYAAQVLFAMSVLTFK
jgi:uncharacterized membrane protein YhhN